MSKGDKKSLRKEAEKAVSIPASFLTIREMKNEQKIKEFRIDKKKKK